MSMMMTCLLQNMEVERATPRLEPVGLATSTSSGPDAEATESTRAETDRADQTSEQSRKMTEKRMPADGVLALSNKKLIEYALFL